MKKVQDIIPSKRRTIREVALENESSKNASVHAEKRSADRGVRVPVHLTHTVETKRKTVSPTLPKTSSPKTKKGKFRQKWLLGISVLVCLLVIGYIISVIFAHATVTITPQSKNVIVDGTYSAARNAVSPNLAFETISTTTTAHISVPAIPGTFINTYATGRAMI